MLRKFQIGFRKFFLFFFLISFLFLSGCPTPSRRTQPSQKEKTPTVTPESEDNKLEDAPKAKAKELSIGLILGPGGVKAFSHLGVLKEFERARIPVKAVVGLEMGSLIGAFYASTGSANEAEWKLSKMKEEDLVERGFFQAKDKPGVVTNLLEFTKRELGARSINEYRRTFGCISISMREEKAVITDSGPSINALKNCIPYPPLFKPTGERVAGVSYIKEAVDYLRLNGCDVVILVNPISGGRFMRDDELLSQPVIGNLWIQVRKNLAESAGLVDYVIPVDTKGIGLMDFGQWRGAMQAGANEGRYHINIISNKFGF
ncbi:MAG: hypothetical protein A4S09_05650 [Proteobacteria bacterium SG_bin7]|nr:MAG: hypothetical protein A4S09_05650 [Proteobacteria bacterium SG_bin7]